VLLLLGDARLARLGEFWLFEAEFYFLSACNLLPPIIFFYIGGDFYLRAYSEFFVGVLLFILGMGGFSFSF
jgi:hypothetical protein